ncbi:MAG: glycosyltransferase family A protein [Patescibacteria group bacterium]|jgi:glycosyltransferase involved in cell wall biosynthesis
MVHGLVSIIIPTYQHADAIPACLNSIFNQTYSCIEIIIVDDGSTDRTQEVLVDYRNHATVIRQENQGSNPARNRGWREAEGEYLIFVDADIVMKPNLIEQLLQALETHADCSFAYCAFRFGWKKFRGVAFDALRLRKRNYIHTTSLVRAADFPGFDPAIRRLQDWDVWLTMVEKGKKGVLVPATLFTARIFGASRIGSSWVPSFFFSIPWKRIGWTPRLVTRYEEARKVIAAKHHL